MKKLKIVSIIVFMLSAILFGGFIAKEKVAKDSTGPVITMDSESIAVSINDGREALLRGVTASDAGDGDITASVHVESVGPMNEKGERKVSYVAFDSDGNVSHALRTMTYTDYTAPVLTLSRNLAYPAGTTNLVDGFTAQDCWGQDITSEIRVLFTESKNVRLAGFYPARVKVIDSTGGSFELPVNYEIYVAQAYNKLPALTLDNYLLYINKGEPFNALDHLNNVTINGAKYTPVEEDGTYGVVEEYEKGQERTIDLNRFTVSGDVDTNTPGCYEVSVSLQDSVYETGTGTVRMYVVVKEGGVK